MSTQTIKAGDIVRLTDPISQGQVVRIESVDEHGCASWLGGAQYSDFEQVSIMDMDEMIYHYANLSELVRDIEDKTGVKLYTESAVQYWKHRAEKAEAENALNEKLLNKEHNKLLDAQDYIKKVCKESSADIQRLDAENKKLKEELPRCRAMNADYLTAKTEAENEVKLLKQEIADLKVPESRQNRHLRDELHKVRLECQQAWECAEKERKKVIETENRRIELEDTAYKVLAKTQKERDELRERNEALKRQLDESNKQIEIYAKKVRNLEAELEEDGGRG